MKEFVKEHRTNIIFLLIIVVCSFAICGYRQWGTDEREKRFKEMIRDATRYDGWTGDSITSFDDRTNRWIAEMKEESIEVTLLKLTDAGEYFRVGGRSQPIGSATEDRRQKTVYATDLKDVLANRRFRKAFEDIKKTDRKIAVKLLEKNIRENLVELRILLQEYKDMYSKDMKAQIVSKGPEIVQGTPDDSFYRLSYYHPERPPTHYARRYAVLSYLLLAAHFGFHEVRPAVEEVIQFAKEEFEFFNIMDRDKAFFFKDKVLYLSLYRPSLLLTATLCDPKWNPEKRKALTGKLVSREIVDWQARALEYDHDAVLGLIPIVPHEEVLKIRYYEGISEAEFNNFFGK